MPRKLVTVRRVAALKPIPNADRIQSATVDGWTCIVPVTEFQVGDLGLYFEIDSFLPASDPRWAFLSAKASTVDGVKGVRIKTMKMKGFVSQGLLMPLTNFPEVRAEVDKLKAALGPEEAEKKIRAMTFEGILGVRKWEKSAANEGTGRDDALAAFPTFIPQTDQERIQNIPDVFDNWGDAVFQETTKMDGSSMTVYFIRRDSPHFAELPSFPAPEDDAAPRRVAAAAEAKQPNGRMGVCSHRRDIAPDPDRLFWELTLRHGLAAKLEAMGRNVALQGELCGDRIQGNFEGFKQGKSDFFLFGVWDVDAERYVSPREVHEEWAPRLGLRHVPVVGYHRLREMGNSVTEMLERAEGIGLYGRKMEGIVLKHVKGEFSFKAISNSYLLKHGE